MHILLLNNGEDETLVSQLHDIVVSFNGMFTLHAYSEAAVPQDVLEQTEIVLCAALPATLRDRMPNLKLVQFWSAGVDGKLYPELFTNPDGRDVMISTGSGIHAASCSEHVLAMMLSFARGIHLSVDAQRAATWSRREQAEKLFTLEGKTVGIVGAGQIGQAIARRCKAFGMRTVGTRRDPEKPTPHFDYVLSHLQYHDLILASDMIVLALPLTPHTRWLFGEEEIEILRRPTYVFNIGRGGLWDERHVLQGVNRGWIAGVGVDVFLEEPLPPDSPWWTARNTIITPHTGGVNPDYWERFGALVMRQLTAIAEGQPCANLVDRDLGY